MNIVSNILFNSIKKIGLKYWINNPIIGIVAAISLCATIVFIGEIINPTGHVHIYFQTTFWLWMTVLFSTFADSYAESKIEHYQTHDGYYQASLLIKKLTNIKDISNFSFVAKEKIRAGNLILLTKGDTVPFDGIIVKGACYVNESDLTGILGFNLKNSDANNVLTAGSIIESTDRIVMKVSFAKKNSFYTRTTQAMKAINRQSLPSELALQRIIIGFSVLFLSVIFTVWVIARYSGFNIPLIYILDLIVLLLPTTISGLQHAIIIFSTSKLQKKGIFIRENIALDNVVDVNIVLFDKTGTITVGKREMTDFVNISEIDNVNFIEFLYLSSFSDVTHEGKSIIRFTEHHEDYKEIIIDKVQYEPLPFSSSEPISGCNYNGMEVRKGSVRSITHYLGKTISDLPENILLITKQIATNHGTPLLLTVDKKIVGVIHLRDRFRKGIMKQIQKFHDHGLHTAVVTGDNAITTRYVAQKIGIEEFYSESTPEKKLELVRAFQQQGYVVAMCGDGINDSLALAQADVGFTFTDELYENTMITGNVISKKHDLSNLLGLKNICKKMTVKRGVLTVFSLTSDIVKYFVIVPALFATAFPPLNILNFMNFQSLDSVILASIMFNALIIPALMPFIFRDFNKPKSQYSLWKGMFLYGVSGIISPFIFIKLIEILIYNLGLV
jgi:K+-transporting ATPase ATPase B chain